MRGNVRYVNVTAFHMRFITGPPTHCVGGPD